MSVFPSTYQFGSTQFEEKISPFCSLSLIFVFTSLWHFSLSLDQENKSRNDKLVMSVFPSTYQFGSTQFEEKISPFCSFSLILVFYLLQKYMWPWWGSASLPKNILTSERGLKLKQLIRMFLWPVQFQSFAQEILFISRVVFKFYVLIYIFFNKLHLGFSPTLTPNTFLLSLPGTNQQHRGVVFLSNNTGTWPRGQTCGEVFFFLVFPFSPLFFFFHFQPLPVSYGRVVEMQGCDWAEANTRLFLRYIVSCRLWAAKVQVFFLLVVVEFKIKTVMLGPPCSWMVGD